jgi:hypothetical protein
MGFKPTPNKKQLFFQKCLLMINKHKETLKLLVQTTLQKLNFHFAHKKSRIHNLLMYVHHELQISTFQNREHDPYLGFFVSSQNGVMLFISSTKVLITSHIC